MTQSFTPEPLPADAATETTLAAINTKLTSGTDIGDVTINNAAGASAVNIQDGGNSLTVDGSVTVEGTLAHDAVDADNPVKIGAKAIAHGSNPTSVAAADVTNIYTNRQGIPFVLGGHPNPVTLSASYIGTQTNTAVLTVASGIAVILGISVFADGGGTGPLDVQVGFGTATITTTKAIIDHPGIVIGSGVTLGFAGGIVAVGASGEDLRITAGGFGTGDELTISILYYTVES